MHRCLIKFPVYFAARDFQSFQFFVINKIKINISMSQCFDSDSIEFSDDGSKSENEHSEKPSTSKQGQEYVSKPKRRRFTCPPPIFESSDEENGARECQDAVATVTPSASTPGSSTPVGEKGNTVNTEKTDTPVRGESKSLRSVLDTLLRQQNEILERIKVLENKEQEKEASREEKIHVPPSVRNAVRDGYSDGLKRGFIWNFEKKRPQDDENQEMSSHISTFVKGWNTTVEERIIQCGLRRYFLSKKQEDVLSKKNKLQDQKQKRVLYERKKEKAKRRTRALEHLKNKGWQTEQRRAQIMKILKVEYTSSDEECEEGFVTHPPSWQSDTFAKVKSTLDKVYLETCSVKSKRLLQKRRIGGSHVKEPPTIPEECLWMLKKD
ncbi:uncharacterized protein LOC134262250 [Saccostrea cucullata]|uniref:uncharacterized protein LOC134262250 n=1 Tax=Saccostrea cuccullata TaxID=36930 RepID=UPI002ED33D1F